MTTPFPTAPTRQQPADSLSLEEFAELADRVDQQVRQVIVGQRELVDTVLACLFAQGHVLLEGVPGLGKTVLLDTLARSLSLDFARIQCVPDLMPADITGTSMLVTGDDGDGGGFVAGPVFTQLLLADEINRATPKTQSALLEAMAELHVTVGGVTRDLPRPFFVMATQNPIEMEGTYPLPEAQLDRFMAKVLVPLPPATDLVEILARTTTTAHREVEAVATADELLSAGRLVRELPMATHVTRYVVDLVQASHPDGVAAPDAVSRYVSHGASPRGAQAMVLLAKTFALLDGRLQASTDDVRRVAGACLRHRLVLGYEALAADVDADTIIESIIERVPEPSPPTDRPRG